MFSSCQLDFGFFQTGLCSFLHPPSLLFFFFFFVWILVHTVGHPLPSFHKEGILDIRSIFLFPTKQGTASLWSLWFQVAKVQCPYLYHLRDIVDGGRVRSDWVSNQWTNLTRHPLVWVLQRVPRYPVSSKGTLNTSPFWDVSLVEWGGNDKEIYIRER